jgi:hypothetical protein
MDAIVRSRKMTGPFPVPSGQPRPRSPRRLAAGLDLLDRWSATAAENDRAAAYEVLFAVADGTVRAGYLVLDDPTWPQHLFVLVRPGLVLKIRAVCPDSFGVTYLGPVEAAPGLDVPADADQSRPGVVGPLGDGA